VSLLELFAASLLVAGSVLVLWTVVAADAAQAGQRPVEAERRPAEDPLRRAA
jgi:hypothetical protein